MRVKTDNTFHFSSVWVEQLAKKEVKNIQNGIKVKPNFEEKNRSFEK